MRAVALLLAGGAIAAGTSAATAATAAAGPLITSFTAGVLKDENVANPKESDYATQAGSHPDVGFTKFTLDTSFGSAQNVRVDLPPGLSVNPQATPRCSSATLTSCAASTRVGTSRVTIANIPVVGKETVEGAVYNMTPPAGAPADFAFEVTVGLLFTVRTDLVGGLRYYPSNGRPGDYGEYFTISNISNTLETALEKSELIFWGAPAEHNGGGGANNAFLTNPTTCAGPQTTYISVSTYAPVTSGSASFTTPVGASGCANEPFNPTISVTPNTTQRDTPDGLGVDLHVPQDQNPAHIATSHLQTAAVTMPAGLTLNPSAANGLQACTDAQFGAGTNAKVECPAASAAGTVEITTPVLSSPLTGTAYVGEPQEGNPYRVFLDAENAASGVAVRLIGSVSADHSTGRLTTTFSNNPQLPFTDLKLAFKTGAAALFANPLTCGTATTSTVLTPYSGNEAAGPTSAFTVDFDGAGGACPATPPFAPAASATPSSTVAGGTTNLLFEVQRHDGEQTLGTVTTKLPEGMLASLSGVTLCPEPAAAAGTCTAASKIGTVTVSAGAGSTPISLPGSVYLTSAYGGGTFGLSIVVPAVAGPYNLGTVVVRAAVAVDTADGVVTITSDPLPTILQGVPLRLRTITVAINRAEFLQNPAYCTPTAITGTIGSTASQSQPFSSPVTDTGCELLGFSPTLSLTPASTQQDAPTGLGVHVHLPAGNAEVREATLRLPAGVTLNPAVAKGLAACTDAQLAVGTENPVTCPAASAIGTVQITTPLLPTPLSGSLYVGQPLSTDPSSGQEYRLFLDAENPGYGLSVRLIGAVAADPATGQLTVTFAHTPPIAFSDLQLDLAGGPLASLAQPLACGTLASTATLTPTTGSLASPTIVPFTVDADGAGAPCPAPAPFALAQSTSDQPAGWGPGGTFSLSLQRGDGQQYLAGVSAALPPGLLGRIAAVALCGEAEAGAGSCPDASRIGPVAVAAGAGATPLELPGSVYLTGPYGGAPYGLVVEVPAETVGPFDFGVVSVRARIFVDEHSARVSVISDPLPTIVGGVPLRLRALTVTVDREGFLVSPTSCAPNSTDTTLSSTLGATQTLSTPLALSGCESIPFAPTFTATTDAGASRAAGASLRVKLGYSGPPQANIAAVSTSLPVQLPSRLTTLQKACPEATFVASPAGCPGPSQVGQASVWTPLLPAPLTGPAYLVSNGGAAFPDLDIVLAGDGLRVVLHGQTDIKAGVTTETFATVPDVPFSRMTVSFPQGQYSLLAANGSLCDQPLAMPVTLTAQNGKRISEQAPMAVTGCPPGSAGSAGGSVSHLRISPARFAAASRGASIAPASPAAAKGRGGSARHHGKGSRRERRTGATVSYTVPSTASTIFFVARPTKGEQRGKSCVAKARRARRRAHNGARSCTRWVRVGSFAHRDRAGAVSFHFTGRVRGRRLAPGGYRLEASFAGATGALPNARFSVTR